MTFIHVKWRIHERGQIFTARKRSLGQGNMFTGMCLSTGRVPGQRGACSGGVPGGDSPGTATAGDGTHPTGMHSCLTLKFAWREKRKIMDSNKTVEQKGKNNH